MRKFTTWLKYNRQSIVNYQQIGCLDTSTTDNNIEKVNQILNKDANVTYRMFVEDLGLRKKLNTAVR